MSTRARQSLRSLLQARGYDVAGDTVGLRGELYVRGAGDGATAMFEFKDTAEEACMSMYQGSWLPTLPLRFAVLPVAQQDDPAVDFLRQAGLQVLFYLTGDEGIVFEDLEEALTMIDHWDGADVP